MELAWDALEGLPGERSCVYPAGKLEVCSPAHRTPHSRCLHHQGTHFHMGTCSRGPFGREQPEPGLPGTPLGWCSSPCPASPTREVLGSARSMALPASMALAAAQHGRVPSAGTGDGDCRARGCLAQPQPPPRGPEFLPWGPPLCGVYVLRGALPACPPPPEIYWGSLPCAGGCYNGGGGGNVQQGEGVLWVLPWVLPSRGRQGGCGCQWVRLWLSWWCWAWGTLLTMYILGGGTAGAQHPGVGVCRGVRARCKRVVTGRGARAGASNPLDCSGQLHQGKSHFRQYLGKERTGRAGGHSQDWGQEMRGSSRFAVLQ